MKTDLDTLLTALYVMIDDYHADAPLATGRPPLLTDSGLVCLWRWRRSCSGCARRPTGSDSPDPSARLFPYLPSQPGYNKRLRAALPLIKQAIRELARDSDFWFDNHWIVDSTPVPCGMSRPTVQRSDLAGWAGYGYCASHSRFFWGLRLYLVCTPTGHADPVGPRQPEDRRTRGPRRCWTHDAGLVAEHDAGSC